MNSVRAMIVCLVCLAIDQVAVAEIDVVFTKVADRDTTAPGQLTKFKFFFDAAIDDGNIGFVGTDIVDRPGVYLYSEGAIERIADQDTLLPGLGTSASYAGVSLDGRNLAFRGGTFGIYAYIDGELRVVADNNLPIFPNSIRFDRILSTFPSIFGDEVAFSATHQATSGVFKYVDGVIHSIADTSTAIPGDTHNFFGDFYSVSLENGSVVFTGQQPVTPYRNGVYVGNGQSLDVVADMHTPVPGGGGTFTSAANGQLRDGKVIFYGGTGGSSGGIYLHEDGVTQRLIDTSTPIAGETGHVMHFVDFSYDNGSLALLGVDSTGAFGLYFFRDGLLHQLIDENDTLDGREIHEHGLYFGSEGLDGDQIAFSVRFNDDGREALYVATVPEPSAFVLAAIAAIIVIRTGDRRRRTRG